MRSIGSARFHCGSPCLRYDTSTAALRLSSPSMNHSKPRLMSVGGSTRNSPAVTASFVAAEAAAEGPPKGGRHVLQIRATDTSKVFFIERKEKKKGRAQRT